MIYEFQQDLKGGMGLDEALRKHDLSLKEALEMCPNAYKPRKRRNKDTKNEWYSAGRYIQKRGRSFYLRKKVGNELIVFGRYNTLSDAKKVRDYFVEHNNCWDISKLNMVCKKLGVKRRG